MADLFDRAGNPIFSQQLTPGGNSLLTADGNNNVVIYYTFSGTTEHRIEGGSGTIKIGH